MAYVRSKMIRGNGPYYYLVKSVRVNGKSQQVHIAYLGKNPSQKSGTATAATLKSVERQKPRGKVKPTKDLGTTETKWPKNAMDFTDKQIGEAIDIHSKKTLRRLRVEQDIVDVQMQEAAKKKDLETVSDQQIKREIIDAAVGVKTFGDKPKDHVAHIARRRDVLKKSLNKESIKKEITTKKQTVDLTGEADRKGIRPKDVNQTQLNKGIKIEMEHTKDKKVAEQIATDHLSENPKYYDTGHGGKERLTDMPVKNIKD